MERGEGQIFFQLRNTKLLKEVMVINVLQSVLNKNIAELSKVVDLLLSRTVVSKLNLIAHFYQSKAFKHHPNICIFINFIHVPLF